MSSRPAATAHVDLPRPSVPSSPAAFYFDLASPLAYLAAERVLQVLPGPAEWRPVLAERLPDGALPAFRCEQEAEAFREDVARRARALHLQPLRWPDPFPSDSALAMRVAAYARSIGRAVPFAQAAFRQAYAAGRDLADPDSVVIAAAACEMHPTAVLRAAGLRSTARELDALTDQALAAGVRSVPAIVVGGAVHEGEGLLERAGAQMRGEPESATAHAAGVDRP